MDASLLLISAGTDSSSAVWTESDSFYVQKAKIPLFADVATSVPFTYNMFLERPFAAEELLSLASRVVDSIAVMAGGRNFTRILVVCTSHHKLPQDVFQGIMLAGGYEDGKQVSFKMMDPMFEVTTLPMSVHLGLVSLFKHPSGNGVIKSGNQSVKSAMLSSFCGGTPIFTGTALQGGAADLGRMEEQMGKACAREIVAHITRDHNPSAGSFYFLAGGFAVDLATESMLVFTSEALQGKFKTLLERTDDEIKEVTKGTAFLAFALADRLPNAVFLVGTRAGEVPVGWYVPIAENTFGEAHWSHPIVPTHTIEARSIESFV